MNIITAYEVIKFGPSRKEYPPGFICNHIKRVEVKAFRKCYLGIAFYNALKDDIQIDDSIDPYDSMITYDTGDLVNLEGCILESLIDGNTTHPDDDDEENPVWTEATKFSTPLYQELWECYLRYWLAFEIMYNSVKYSTYDIGAKGVTKVIQDDTGIGTVNMKELQDLKNQLQHKE